MRNTESYFKRCAKIFGSVKSLRTTNSIPFLPHPALKTVLPILPKPLIAIRSFAILFIFSAQGGCASGAKSLNLQSLYHEMLCLVKIARNCLNHPLREILLASRFYWPIARLFDQMAYLRQAPTLCQTF